MNSELTGIQPSTVKKSFHAFDNFQLTAETIRDAIGLSVFSTDFNGKITSVNKGAERTIGYSPREVIGQSLSAFLLTEDVAKIEKERVREGNTVNEFYFKTLVADLKGKDDSVVRELALLNKEGKAVHFIVSIKAIFQDNEATGFLLIGTNISEQKKNELAWKESENKFRLLAENVPGTIYLCKNDPTYSPIYLNDHIEHLTGYTAQEFITGAINFVQLYHPEDVEMIFGLVDRALAEKKNFNLEYRIRHRSGKYKWVHEVGIGLYENDELLMLEGYLSDITDKKLADEELKRSQHNLTMAAQSLQVQNNQLNNFAHILSHNLRSPVGNIGALISLLDEKSSLEDYKKIFENLKHTSSRLQETLNDLMETLRIKKETDIKRITLSFEETLNKVRNDLAGELIKINAIIKTDFSQCQEIVYPKTYLESILLNLLSNALKYRSHHRELVVEFKTYIDNEKVHLSISDNGQGIDLDKFGDQLFGLRKTFHDHPEARGVGLFLTNTQIEAMGGAIQVESKVNEGSTFIIQF